MTRGSVTVYLDDGATTPVWRPGQLTVSPGVHRSRSRPCANNCQARMGDGDDQGDKARDSGARCSGERSTGIRLRARAGRNCRHGPKARGSSSGRPHQHERLFGRSGQGAGYRQYARPRPLYPRPHNGPKLGRWGLPLYLTTRRVAKRLFRYQRESVSGLH